MDSIEVLLRAARPEDAVACATIFNTWVDATPWMPRVHPADDVERHFRETVLPTREVTVAERDGRILGFLALHEAHVDGLYLDGAARRQGVGARLLEAAKTACPSGLTLWTFVDNAPARAFYAAQGFIELRRTDGDNEEALPDIFLAWPGSL